MHCFRIAIQFEYAIYSRPFFLSKAFHIFCAFVVSVVLGKVKLVGYAVHFSLKYVNAEKVYLNYHEIH